jgi:hypothetical protein
MHALTARNSALKLCLYALLMISQQCAVPGARHLRLGPCRRHSGHIRHEGLLRHCAAAVLQARQHTELRAAAEHVRLLLMCGSAAYNVVHD